MVHTRARTRQLREFAPRLIPLGRRRPQCRGAKCHLGSSWGCNGLRVCLRDDLAHWVNQWCPSHSFPPPLPLPPLLLPGEVSFEGNLDNSLSSIVLCFILSLSLSPSHTHTHTHTQNTVTHAARFEAFSAGSLTRCSLLNCGRPLARHPQAHLSVS